MHRQVKSKMIENTCLWDLRTSTRGRWKRNGDINSQAGQNLSEIEDIEYFKKKLYRALNVPISRMESDNGFNMGRSSEISRDELKFNKFTNRLQKKFARVFTDILKTQLVLRGVVTGEEFDKFKDFILYDFATDNHFTELKEIGVNERRFDTLSQKG